MRKYLRKLAESLKDDKNVATEMYLAWLSIVMTGILLLMLLGYCQMQ